MKTDSIINASNATGAGCSGLTAIYGFIQNSDPALILGFLGLLSSAIVNFYFNIRKIRNERYLIDEEIKLKKIEIEKKLSIDLEIKNREFELLKTQNEELKNALINQQFKDIEK